MPYSLPLRVAPVLSSIVPEFGAVLLVVSKTMGDNDPGEIFRAGDTPRYRTEEVAAIKKAIYKEFGAVRDRSRLSRSPCVNHGTNCMSAVIPCESKQW